LKDDGLVHPVPFAPRPLRLVAPPRRRRHLPRAALLAALVLVLGAAALVFARAVEVQVEPAPDRLSVSGLQLRFGSLFLLYPGPHTVRAEKEGYRPLEAGFEVTRDARQVARFAFERLPTLLALEVEPAAGVRVVVDGAEQGVTPLAPLPLTAGEHEVLLRAEGYAAFGTKVTVAGGGDTQVLKAALLSDRASISFSSEPTGATLRVDGQAVGQTPLTVDLSSGTRRVEVSLAGFASAGRTLAVEAEKPQVLPPFRLTPLPGRLQVTTEPPGAVVTVDGAFRGESPLEADVPAGRGLVVKATKAGHESAQTSVSLGRGESQAVVLRLVPQLGEVRVEAEPADASVLVDGEPKGRAGQTFRLTAAPHDIEVKREGYETHKANIVPRPGFPKTLKVTLRSEKETQAAARPPVIRPAGHELRLFGGGRFQMGASRREAGRRANETLREVVLVRPFYLGAREITNAQFRRFKPDHASGRFGHHELGGDALPVVQVAWEDAAAYCNWLSAQEGRPPAYVSQGGKLVGAKPLNGGYRLPTEAEWSRAARYPSEGPLKYPWGQTLPAPPKAGNFADESARTLVPVVLQGYDDGYPATAPVGSYSPNALLMFDLGGNVAEWVHDLYAIPPADGPVERDPIGPEAGELHVILGSSFLHGSVSELRLSYRDYALKPRADVGFRIARYAE